MTNFEGAHTFMGVRNMYCSLIDLLTNNTDDLRNEGCYFREDRNTHCRTASQTNTILQQAL